MASSLVIFGLISPLRSTSTNIPSQPYFIPLGLKGPCGTCPPGSNAKIFNTTNITPCPVGIQSTATTGLAEVWLVAGYVFASVADANTFLSSGDGLLFKNDMNAVFVIKSI